MRIDLNSTPSSTTTIQQPIIQIERPPKGTLARGMYEVRPIVLWSLLSIGTLAFFIYAWLRMRKHL